MLNSNGGPISSLLRKKDCDTFQHLLNRAETFANPLITIETNVFLRLKRKQIFRTGSYYLAQRIDRNQMVCTTTIFFSQLAPIHSCDRLSIACTFPILRSESKKKKSGGKAERAFENRYICLILE